MYVLLNFSKSGYPTDSYLQKIVLEIHGTDLVDLGKPSAKWVGWEQARLRTRSLDGLTAIFAGV